MKYRYFTCDVFTTQRFGGNPLAVLPFAEGLSTELMQRVAREFNYSETTFVLPPEANGTRRVRIFTPTQEVPFAGHPNIGTAFTLASMGEIDVTTTVEFEELAGSVPIEIIRNSNGSIRCELEAPQPLQIGKATSAATAAAILSLAEDDIVISNHPPQEASVGLPFLMVELRDREALSRAQLNLDELRALAQTGMTHDVHLYTRFAGELELHARMFAPLDGVPEDPATGSANCALVSMLTEINDSQEGDFSWQIIQGEDMGRPSLLAARTRKDNGHVTRTWIGGDCVMVCEGEIEVG